MENVQEYVSPPFVAGDGPATGKFPRVLVMPPTAGGSSDTGYTMDLRTREASPAVVGGEAYMRPSCLHSSGGWLLMLSADSGAGRKPYLIEPRTGLRVDLPALPLMHQPAATAFSITSGYPDAVVFFDRDYRHPHMLATRISDGRGAGEWESFRYLNTWGCGAFRYGAVVGDEVWYVDTMGKAVAIDLRDGGGQWRVLCGEGWGRRNAGCGRQFFLVAETAESAGPTVIRIHCPAPCYGVFRFTRLDGQRGEWVPLTEGELDGTSWFLSNDMAGQRSFVLRGVDSGKKAYLLSPDDEKREGRGGRTRILRPLPAVQQGNVYVHDLDAGTSETLFPEPYLMTAQSWVHPDCF